MGKSAAEKAGNAQIARSDKTQDEFMAQFRDMLAKNQSFLPQIQQLFNMSQSSLGGEEGLSPDALASLKGQAIDSTGRFDAAESGLKSMLARRGLMGGTGSSGLIANPFGALEAAKEGERAGALRNVTMANEQAKTMQRQMKLQGGSELMQQLLGATNYQPFMQGALGFGNLAGQAGFTLPRSTFWGNLANTAVGAGIGALSGGLTGGGAGKSGKGFDAGNPG